MPLPDISLKAFYDWGPTVPKQSRWWIDDERFEALSLLLDSIAGPISYSDFEIPVFALQWRGVVTIYRKSQFPTTRQP